MKSDKEKRRHPRLRKRLQIIIENDPWRVAYTTNISISGLCVVSDFVATPDTRISGDVVLPDGKNEPFDAVVRWANKARAGSSMGKAYSMGLDFITPPGDPYLALIDFGFRRPGQKVSPTVATQQASGTVAPPPTSPRPLDWPVSPLGQIGRQETEIAGALRDSGRSTLSLSIATRWMEEAAAKAVASMLPRGVTTVGIGAELSLAPPSPPVSETPITTTARAIGLTDQGRILTFEVTFDDGQRQLGSGRLALMLLDLPAR